MTNLTMKRQGNRLIIEIDLGVSGTPSSTGKTQLIASSRGNTPIPGCNGYYIGVNCFKYDNASIDEKAA
ncbi:MAG TPA: hypothetical protein VN613_07640 [Gemmatimonadaceae bacterium]|nr:hypothetical protein [Gemmatimonadaceae bacterium]